MRGRICVGLSLFAVVAIAPPARATSQIDRDSIRAVYSDWRTALRHGRGQEACDVMTPRMRDKVRLILDPEFGWDTCQETLEVLGRGFYRTIRSFAPLSRIRVRGVRGWALPGWYFLWDSANGWRLHYPPAGERRRYPELPIDH